MTSPVGSAASVFRTTAQEREVIHEDLGPILLLPGFPVIPRTSLNLSFDQDLRTFPYIVADDLGGAVERDKIVPLRPVLPVSLTVLLAVGGGE
jgi:hypothetical protein